VHLQTCSFHESLSFCMNRTCMGLLASTCVGGSSDLNVFLKYGGTFSNFFRSHELHLQNLLTVPSVHVRVHFLSHNMDDDEDSNVLYPNRTAQKTLILAIDALGGLEALDAPFALKGICDKYPLLLGAKGTRERRGVQFKVRDWKEHPDQYDEALLEALRTTALIPGIRPAPVARRPSSSNESSTAASSSRASVTMPRTPPCVRGKSRTPPASAKRAATEPPPDVDEEPPPPPLYYGKIPWLQKCFYFMLHSLIGKAKGTSCCFRAFFSFFGIYLLFARLAKTAVLWSVQNTK
jgi:hypothetical protein